MKAILGAGAVIVLTVAGCLFTSTASVDAQEAKAVKKVRTDTSGCITCHEGKDLGQGRIFAEKFGSDQFILLNESTLWQSQDPHSRAFTVLKDAKNETLINSMSKRLGYDVLTSANCLVCHATDRGADQSPRFDYEYGVVCASCHGVDAAWQSEHYEQKPNEKQIVFRELSVAAKSQSGLVNLRDCTTKANKCISCHVGNVSEGKIITHDMYAAGHPPLPPFELMSFLSDQPNHWRLPEEIKISKDIPLTPQMMAEHYSVIPGDHTPSRHILIGAVAALKAEVELLEHATHHDTAKTAGLDYARFDCYSCHHDLKLPSVRQQRGYPDRNAGRPPLKAWTAALARIAAEYTGTTEPFDKAWVATQAAATAKPFGDAKLIGDTLKGPTSMLAWCDETLKKLKALPAIAKSEGKLKSILVAALQNDRNLNDSEAAMVLLWALNAVDPTDDRLAKLKEKKLLPVNPRPVEYTTAGGKSPTTAGDAAIPRMDLFNAFDTEDKIAAFKAIFATPAK